MKLFIDIFLITLLITQTTTFVLLNNHNNNTLTGNLDAAQFCENIRVGTVIYQLTAHAGTGFYNFELAGDLSHYVSTNKSSGEITLINKFNRELKNVIDVTSTVKDVVGGTFDEKTTSIYVMDANDNAPIIRDISYTEHIYEYPWTPKVFANVSVSDADVGRAGAVMVDIEGTDLIYISENYKGNTSILQNTSMKLDYDRKPVIKATLIAKDGGTAPCNPNTFLNSSQKLFFQLEDGPDQPPIFRPPSIDLEVAENLEKGIVIGKVEAFDQDYALDWQIIYEIVKDGVSENLFNVSESGDIVIVNKIDREALSFDTSIHHFRIKATEVVPLNDQFSWKQNEVGYPFSTEASVTVLIKDEDDNIPIFYTVENPSDLSSKVVATEFVTSIDEGLSVGSDVQGLNIYVEDVDQGSNAEFMVKILEEVPFKISVLNISGSSHLAIRNTEALDFEKPPNIFNFTIVTSKQNAIQELSRATVKIIIKDINDNSPSFQSDLLTFNLLEQAPIGTKVGHLQATDADSGEHGHLTYSILVGYQFFKVSSTGDITVNTDHLDRETAPKYHVIFAATDGGGLTSTVPAEIILLDINDNPPVILRDSYYFIVKEEEFVEVLIQADDMDVGENSQINFSIMPNNFNKNFKIETNGNNSVFLKNSSVLDIEQIFGECQVSDKQIDLVIKAEDNGTPSLSSSTNVYITLQDENEFAPKFNISNPLVVEVDEEAAYGTEITKIEAYDLDACSPNKDFDFSIGGIYSLDFNIIQLDDNKGSLQIRNSALDRDKQESYEVEVIATDLGTPRKSTSYFIIVNLLDVNNKSPQFVGSSLNEVSIAENATIDTVIHTLAALDLDTNSDLYYKIVFTECFANTGLLADCSNWFDLSNHINNRSQIGRVIVASNLDREISDEVRLTVQVEDLNSQTDKMKTVRGILKIKITDVNDQKPKFAGYQVFEVDEETSNTMIGQMLAIDGDIGLNSEIRYSISEECKDVLQIDALSGKFSTNKPLDRETMGSYYNATIIATDKGDPPLSSSTTVFIKIRDSNDNHPEITNLPAVKNVTEDESINKVIFTVQSFDEDEGRNAEIFYSLVETDLPFAINRTTGEIKITEELDYERVKSYKITVKASDNSAQLTLTDEATLTVNVEDVNDNPASFDQSSQVQSINIEEGPPGDTGVFIKPATDADSPTLQTNYYYVVGGNGKNFFHVNKKTQRISRLVEIDRERDVRFDLVVQVSDISNIVSVTDLDCSEVELLDEFSCIHVHVTDINDQSPRFMKKHSMIDISIETQPSADIPITQVFATDLDEDKNSILSYSITKQTKCCRTCQNLTQEIFVVHEKEGKVFFIQPTILTGNCHFNVHLFVTDGIVEHFDESLLTIGVIKEDQTITLLSIISTDDFTRQTRNNFEQNQIVLNQFEFVKDETNYLLLSDLAQFINSTVLIDKVLPYTEPKNSQIKSQITFHVKDATTNTLIPVSIIDKTLDSGKSDINLFLAKYGIKGRTMVSSSQKSQKVEIAFISTTVCLGFVCLTLVTSVLCLKQTIKRNKRVEKAMEKTFEEMEKYNSTGASNSYRTNANPLYDICDTQLGINMETAYDSTDDDEIDDNVIDNIDSVNTKDEISSGCGSVCDNFQIDFPQTVDDEATNNQLSSDSVGEQNTFNCSFEDTGF